MNYKDISQENVDNHINRIIDVVDEIVENGVGKVTILTGGNASGKSVIRKLLAGHLADKLGIERKKADGLVCSTSMQLRTSGSSNYDIIASGMARMSADLPWLSTSEQTVNLVQQLFNSCVEKVEDESEKKFIVIDELEIGMSKETQLGACIWLNEILKDNLSNTLGVLIITHSDTAVQNVRFDNFINIDGMTCDEWMNREVVPVMPDELDKWASALFRGIRDREKKN
jgi:archaellum biogenesis ATPase FlaH